MDDDLLAEVKAEAEAAARAEMDRFERDRLERRAAEDAAAADAAAAREAEITALLESERARQLAVAEHRERMFTPPHGVQVRTLQPGSEPPRHAPVAPRAPVFAAALTPPAPDPGRGAVFYVNVVALPLLCVTAIVLALVYTQRVVPQPLPVVQTAPVLLEVADAPYALAPEFELTRVVAPPPAPVVRPNGWVRTPPVRKPKPKPTPRFELQPIDGDTR